MTTTPQSYRQFFVDLCYAKLLSQFDSWEHCSMPEDPAAVDFLLDSLERAQERGVRPVRAGVIALLEDIYDQNSDVRALADSLYDEFDGRNNYWLEAYRYKDWLEAYRSDHPIAGGSEVAS